ncbi:MAG: glycosyltransferase [Cytophagia bacterium]|nr:glycosyltransferase [Cytophagia bacterium]
MSKEKIIFLSSKQPFTKKDWSGIPFFLYQALDQVYDVEYVSLPQFKRLKLFGYYFNKVFHLVTGKKYLMDYGLIIALLNGFAGTWKMRKRKAKFIFSPAGLSEIAFLSTAVPIVSFGDCSTLQLIDYYTALINVSGFSRKEIEFVESKAFKRTKISILSSSWAGDFVKHQYRKDSTIIPFGSNLNISYDRLPKSFYAKQTEYHLLFIGVDWKRKGGDIAVQTHKQLIDMGIKSKLTIVGTKPPANLLLPGFVTVIPNLNKDSNEGEEFLKSLFERASFFILPTLADCTPIVIAEAYSFGIPVLSSDTGGISSMVMHEVTGYLIHDYDPKSYAKRVHQLISDPSLYRTLSENCLKYYKEKYNWSAAIDNLKEVVLTSIDNKNG